MSRPCYPGSFVSIVSAPTAPKLATPPAAFREILTQPLRTCTRIGERDIAVRPHEVQGSLLQTGASHRRLPHKYVQWKPQLGASLAQSACPVPLPASRLPPPASRLSIHMHLPLDRCQRRQ